METIGDIGLLMIGFGIGMGLGAIIGLVVEGIERYENWKLEREWRL